MRPINVLSLFDWMWCWRVALERAWIPVASYYASEIDRYAIQVSKKNYPSIIHIGDVSKCGYRYMSGRKKHQWYYLLGEPNSDPLCSDNARSDRWSAFDPACCSSQADLLCSFIDVFNCYWAKQ